MGINTQNKTKKPSQKEPIFDVMNVNKETLIVFMAGPRGWGLKEMSLKRTYRISRKGVTLLNHNKEELGSWSSPDSPCLHLSAMSNV